MTFDEQLDELRAVAPNAPPHLIVLIAHMITGRTQAMRQFYFDRTVAETRGRRWSAKQESDLIAAILLAESKVPNPARLPTRRASSAGR
jgi:hypothetical protein